MHGSLRDRLERVHRAGYDGIETSLPSAEEEADFRALLRGTGLRYIAVVSSPPPRGAFEWGATGGDRPIDQVAVYRSQLERALTFGPDKITALIGHDSMPDREVMTMYEQAVGLESGLGVAVGHETHRRRPFFTPWATARVLRAFPDLRICADYSHWVVVAQRLLDDRLDDLALAHTRAIHLQGRVGHPQAPQLNDPRAPEHGIFLDRFESWWREIVRHRLAAGDEEFSFDPEYGPPGYMQVQPYSQEPVADLDEVNAWAVRRFRAWFETTTSELAAAGQGPAIDGLAARPRPGPPAQRA
jgi:sugar phosphate isomerase/epimerase